jgi:hypothetical protein
MNCRACNEDLEGRTTCQCGYVFDGPQAEAVPILSAIDRSLRSIKSILTWWTVLTVAGAVLWVVYVNTRP